MTEATTFTGFAIVGAIRASLRRAGLAAGGHGRAWQCDTLQATEHGTGTISGQFTYRLA